MSKILGAHSPFFWMYLYRRIKPALSKLDDNKTDRVTVRLVREIADLAIQKYSNLSINNDVKRSSELSYESCWGGSLKKAIEELPSAQRTAISEVIINNLKEVDSFNPSSFESTNYRDIYEVEGLAYEYWLCTARLRSLGKGHKCHFYPKEKEFFDERKSELEKAILYYDERGQSGEYIPTFVGVISKVLSERDALKNLLVCQYNIDNIDISDLINKMGLPVKVADGGSLTNCLPIFLSATNFSNAHSYLNNDFEKKWGFSFVDLIQLIWALSNLAMVPNAYLEDPERQSLGLFFLRLLKRGYAIYLFEPEKGYGALYDRLTQILGLPKEAADALIAKVQPVLAFLTLDQGRQKSMSLWSGGPRAIIVPHGKFIVIDLVGLVGFLQRSLTGVRDDGKIRGELFEDAVRNEISNSLPKGMQTGQRKIKVAGQLKDEIDLLLRKGDTVWVCECFSMWRPLSIEVGEESILNNRTERLREKLAQADELQISGS
ncbi:MAG: hypothetical protein IPK23_15495 [Rhizobiales bacterium]|nr:hypothetical protein [Hyphomicrobiales bacterium]